MPALGPRSTALVQPPQGVTAHPADTFTIPPELIATASVCLFLVTAATCARMFTKLFDLKHLQVDDYAILFTAGGFVTFLGLFVEAASYGLGAHIWDISAESVKRALLFSNVLDILYAPVMFSAKFAVLVQIGRIFSGIRKRVIYWAVRVLIAANALCYTAIFFSYIFSCRPRTKITDPTVPGKCIPQNASFITTGTVNVISNAAILLLPLYPLRRLRLPSRRKVSIAIVYSVGILSSIASIARLAYGVKVGDTEDITETIWPVNLWALAEFTFVIIVACCPTFPRLIEYFQGKTLRATYPKVHEEWISPRTSRSGNPDTSSRSQIFYPATSYLSFDPERQSTLAPETTREPTREPTPEPAREPTPEPAQEPTPEPAREPIPEPAREPTPEAGPSAAHKSLAAHAHDLAVTTKATPMAFENNEQEVAKEVGADMDKEVDLAEAPESDLENEADIDTEGSPESIPLSRRPTSRYEPFERPVSHISYDSYTNATIDEIIGSGTPLSPMTPGAMNWSTPQLQSATEMSVTPIHTAAIRKTVEVRLSNHTNPGSPIRFNKPEPTW